MFEVVRRGIFLVVHFRHEIANARVWRVEDGPSVAALEAPIRLCDAATFHQVFEDSEGLGEGGDRINELSDTVSEGMTFRIGPSEVEMKKRNDYLLNIHEVGLEVKRQRCLTPRED